MFYIYEFKQFFGDIGFYKAIENLDEELIGFDYKNIFYKFKKEIKS
tara:strand:- start:476 stop:613 length:138 start_codon:yes stop_codon:yes gene_type:complete